MHTAAETSAGVESKHPAISDELRRRICRDGLSGKLPSVRTLAAEFRVNKTTANKALESLAKEGLVRSEQGRGYFVVRRKTPTVVLLVYDSDIDGDDFYSLLARNIVDRLTRKHVRHEVCCMGVSTGSRDFPVPESISKDRNKVVLTVGIQNRRYLRSLMEAGFGVVAFDYVPTDPAITAVGIDGVTSGAEATRYLIESGARDIVYIGHHRGEVRELDSMAIELGYRLVMEEEGLQPRSDFATRCNQRDGREAFGRLLENGPFPDAVFSSNTDVTRGVREYCEEKGIRVPQDLKMLGFGRAYQDLPSMEIGVERYCRAAVDLVVQRLAAGDFEPRQVLVRPQLVKLTKRECCI